MDSLTITIKINLLDSVVAVLTESHVTAPTGEVHYILSQEACKSNYINTGIHMYTLSNQLR